MSRPILTAALAAVWFLAFDTLPTRVSNTPALFGSAHARGTTVKSSKSNTSDRKNTQKKPGPWSPGGPGGRGY